METSNTPKQTGLDSISSTLTRGSYGEQVKALQQYLNGLGYDVGKVDSVYGPKVEAAVKQFQLDNGLSADGKFGPATIGKAKVLGTTSDTAGDPGTGKPADDPSHMFNTETGALNPNFVPKTQAEADKYYNTAALSHPIFAGNSPDALAYAGETGDFSNLSDSKGQPFTAEQQAAAVSKSSDALKPGFDAEKTYDTQNTESTLSKDNLDYEKGLETDKQNFQTDKTNLDKNAADNGILFSGARTQKEKQLQNAYTLNDAYNQAKAGNSIAGTANTYQYAYGTDAANDPKLSKYYSLGGNTFNANSARNNVGSSGLSSIYNPSGYDYQGTKVNANKANTQVRAAGLLANRGNKLLSTGYTNQF